MPSDNSRRSPISDLEPVLFSWLSIDPEVPLLTIQRATSSKINLLRCGDSVVALHRSRIQNSEPSRRAPRCSSEDTVEILPNSSKSEYTNAALSSQTPF